MRLLVLCCTLLWLAGCASTPVAGKKGDLKEAAKINVQLGINYMRQGRHQLALEKLKRALSQDPDLSAGHNAIAIVYEQLDDAELAEGHYERAVDLDERDVDALNNYARFLCMRGKHEDAEDLFADAIAVNRMDKADLIYTNSGVCALQAKNPALAESRFRKALRMNPKFPQALWHMARLGLEKNNALSARAYLQRYQEVAPESAESLWLGAQVERRLGDAAARTRYEALLKAKFPDSAEAMRLMESGYHESK